MLWFAVGFVTGGALSGYGAYRLASQRIMADVRKRQMAIERTLHNAGRKTIPWENAGPARQSKIRFRSR